MSSHKPRCKQKLAIATYVATTACLLIMPHRALAETEEQRLINIAQKLKPISDSAWNEIAGGKTTETYDLQKGDTLWDVSKRLFGNAYYWPKVWSLNGEIRNPHVVVPGQKLAFTPGSSEATPRLAPSQPAQTASRSRSHQDTSGAPETAAEDSNATPEYLKIDPNKWRPTQPTLANNKDFDEYGFEKISPIGFYNGFQFRVPAIANDATIPFLGEIVGSRREAVSFGQHETVFLKSSTQDLQVNTTYSILGEATYAHEKKSDRSGYIYRSVGEVKIVGIKDELYVGVITKSLEPIRRGYRVYPLLPSISGITPTAANSALEALVIATHGTTRVGQFQFVHFDRGIEDGVQLGNVFRIYDYYDPTTKDKLTDSDFLIHADAIVVHTTAQFSTALILRSREPFSQGDFGVLLTDVSDLSKKRSTNTRGIEPSNDQQNPEDKELDELDALDRAAGEGIGKQEETEIKELDQWDRTKDMQNSPTQEPTTPANPEQPTDDAVIDQIEQNPTAPSAPEPTLDEALDSPTPEPEPQPQDPSSAEPAAPAQQNDGSAESGEATPTEPAPSEPATGEVPPLE